MKILKNTLFRVIIVVLFFGFIMTKYFNLYDYFFSPLWISEEKVVCSENKCTISFQVTNRTDQKQEQEFYVGVWPNLDLESDQNKGELGYTHAKISILPHEKREIRSVVYLNKPMIKEGVHALVQKAWW